MIEPRTTGATNDGVTKNEATNDRRGQLWCHGHWMLPQITSLAVVPPAMGVVNNRSVDGGAADDGTTDDKTTDNGRRLQ